LRLRIFAPEWRRPGPGMFVQKHPSTDLARCPSRDDEVEA
jgi:hypothetical protein